MSVQAISWRRRIALLLAVSFMLLGLASLTAKANYIVTTVTNPALGLSAIVAEQISFAPLLSPVGCVVNPGGANGCVFDYAFAVGNTGPNAIDGFFLVAGKLPGGGIPAGDLEYATAAIGANGPFPAVGAAKGPPANTPLDAVVPETNVPGWDFEQFDDGAGAAPVSYYAVGWNSNGGPVLPVNFYTVFNLYSTFGPISGYGGIDPFSGSTLNFEDINGSASFPDALTGLQMCGGSTGNTCDSSLPSQFNSLREETPEPASILLFATGLLAAGLLLRRRLFDSA